uniref:Uncharacterized protein n=1 Tax=Macrostomum lignano TaxID=282301 RepID=A0A1I8H981_9PLAT
MRTGQVWVFLEIGLGVVFIITLFCLCRFFDMRKSRRRKNKAKAADEDCYQRQLAQQRERALSIRRESLMNETASNPENAAAKEPLTSLNQDCSSWTLE